MSYYVINQDDLNSVQNENFFKTCKRVIEKFIHIKLLVILALKILNDELDIHLEIIEI